MVEPLEPNNKENEILKTNIDIEIIDDQTAKITDGDRINFMYKSKDSLKWVDIANIKNNNEDVIESKENNSRLIVQKKSSIKSKFLSPLKVKKPQYRKSMTPPKKNNSIKLKVNTSQEHKIDQMLTSLIKQGSEFDVAYNALKTANLIKEEEKATCSD